MAVTLKQADDDGAYSLDHGSFDTLEAAIAAAEALNKQGQRNLIVADVEGWVGEDDDPYVKVRWADPTATAIFETADKLGCCPCGDELPK